MTQQMPPEQSPEKQALIAVDEGKKKNLQKKASTSPLDWFKLLIAAVIAGGGVWAYYQLLGQPFYVRALIAASAVLIALLMAFLGTGPGRRLIRYFGDSWKEFKKVVWLPRNDALSMSVKVVIFVLVLAAFIYGVDTLISLIFNALLVRG
ncbi:preprotein translocase subunit SecE [Neisseria sp.]|uniref:preprotein translocase subunit SecE n=1 Tax=Neisseria sp. TaxID=192066 RepID=UPI00289BB80C|nr:preprotein translocase subunit SecE [Neisseria sp.]